MRNGNVSHEVKC